MQYEIPISSSKDGVTQRRKRTTVRQLQTFFETFESRGLPVKRVYSTSRGSEVYRPTTSRGMSPSIYKTLPKETRDDGTRVKNHSTLFVFFHNCPNNTVSRLSVLSETTHCKLDRELSICLQPEYLHHCLPEICHTRFKI